MKVIHNKHLKKVSSESQRTQMNEGGSKGSVLTDKHEKKITAFAKEFVL